MTGETISRHLPNKKQDTRRVEDALDTPRDQAGTRRDYRHVTSPSLQRYHQQWTELGMSSRNNWVYCPSTPSSDLSAVSLSCQMPDARCRTASTSFRHHVSHAMDLCLPLHGEVLNRQTGPSSATIVRASARDTAA